MVDMIMNRIGLLMIDMIGIRICSYDFIINNRCG